MKLINIITASVILLSSIESKVIPQQNKDQLIQLPLIKRRRALATQQLKRRYVEDYQLYNDQRIEYLTKVYIGTPAQVFYVSIDTGSSDLWVPSTKCPKSQCIFNTFQQDKSSTLKPMNQTFTIQYGSGSITGDYVMDKINLLGKSSKLSIDSQTFGLATTAKDYIISTVPTKKPTSNGILGLGFPSLTANSDTLEAYTPFVFNLAKQKLISQPVFSIDLGNAVNEWSTGGQLTLGGVDYSKYTGELFYLPVTKNINPKNLQLEYTFWTIELSKITLTTATAAKNTTTINVNKDIMLDTGTTLSYLNKEMTEAILDSVTEKREFDKLNQVYLVDCDLISSKKKIELSFGKVTFQLDVHDLILPPMSSDTQQCTFGITYGFDDKNTLVLGDTVLKSAYFVFDMGKKRIGIATPNHSSNTRSKVFKSK